jgi:hypothetical protein
MVKGIVALDALNAWFLYHPMLSRKMNRDQRFLVNIEVLKYVDFSRKF